MPSVHRRGMEGKSTERISDRRIRRPAALGGAARSWPPGRVTRRRVRFGAMRTPGRNPTRAWHRPPRLIPEPVRDLGRGVKALGEHLKGGYREPALQLLHLILWAFSCHQILREELGTQTERRQHFRTARSSSEGRIAPRTTAALDTVQCRRPPGRTFGGPGPRPPPAPAADTAPARPVRPSSTSPDQVIRLQPGRRLLDGLVDTVADVLLALSAQTVLRTEIVNDQPR